MSRTIFLGPKSPSIRLDRKANRAMALKRSAATALDGIAPPIRSRHAHADKRVRLDSDTGAQSSAASSSTVSVSEASALRSTPPASSEEHESRRRRLRSSGSGSSVSSAVETPSSEDESSSTGGDEDEDEDEEEEDMEHEEEDRQLEIGKERVAVVGGAQKPAIGPPEVVMRGARELRERLGTLLPQLAAAEAMLGQEGVCMEGEGEGGAWIEMDLGLGVLEEVGASGEAQDASDEEGDEGNGIMDRLMGRGRRGRGGNVGIEELG